MSTTELSDQEKVFKAQALQQRMDLEQDLTKFLNSLGQLFAIAPPLKLNAAEKKELDDLRVSITDASVGNQVRARIMELLGKGLNA